MACGVVLTEQVEKSSVGEISGSGVAGFRAMAQGFRSFVDAIMTAEVVSAETCHLATEVLDSWPEKLSAWRAALYVSSVVVRTDLEIIGTSSNSGPGKSSHHLGRLVVGHL